MDASNIGKFIRDKRKEKNFTQADIAMALNISPQAVSKWERFESLPDIASLPELAKVLGVQVEDIINSGIVAEEDDLEDIIYILNTFVKKGVFEKLLTKLRKTKRISETNISLNIFTLLNTQQKDEILEILLEMEDYNIIIDEIIQYLNNAQRNRIMQKILDNKDFVYLETLIPFISKNAKTNAINVLLTNSEFEILEEITPFLNRDQKDIIISYFLENKQDFEILENFIPFFDTKQRKTVMGLFLN